MTRTRFGTFQYLGSALAAHFRLCVCVGFLGVLLIYVSLSGTPMVYPLDDTYIHMALARTLASHGVWGVAPSVPAAASSSPLWSLVLASVYLALPTGWSKAFDYAPLVVNGIASVATLLLWDRILAQAAPRQGMAWRWFGLLVLCLVTPLVSIAAIGMEHVLHIFLATLLIWLVACDCSCDGREISPMLIFVAATLAVASRYETVFAVLPLVAIALMRRRFRTLAALTVGAVVPVVGFGMYWQAKGAFFVPNALLIKGASPGTVSSVTQFLVHFLNNIWVNFHTGTTASAVLGEGLVLSVLFVLYVRRFGSVWHIAPLTAIVALSATVLQFAIASVGWLYRYEAWLIAIDSLAIMSLLPKFRWRHKDSAAVSGTVLARWPAVAVVALCLATAPRALHSTTQTLMASADRRAEHVPMAEFIQEYYDNSVVLVNDFGMASYFSDAHVLDIYGLGSNPPIVFRRQPGGYTRDRLAEWSAAEHAAIAVLNICWTEIYPRVPSAWRLVEIWRIPRNVVFGDRDIGIFAIDPNEIAVLRLSLSRFHVPPDVEIIHPNERTFQDFVSARDTARPSPEGLCPS